MRKDKQNILARADDFIAKHRIAFILIMISLVIGICVGSLATSSGIKAGHWQKDGYFYMLPPNNILVININTTNIRCSGLTIQSGQYHNVIDIEDANYGYAIYLNDNKIGGCGASG